MWTHAKASNNTFNEMQAPQRININRRIAVDESLPTESFLQSKEYCPLYPRVLSKCDENVRTSKPRRTRSFRSVLSESIEVSRFSGHSGVAFIENTMANIKVDGSMESKLARSMMENENDHISSNDAIVAAVTDMMHNQNDLCNAESAVKSLTDRNLSLVSENLELQSELNLVRLEMEALRKSNEELVAQKQKMAANLRKKRDMLTETANNLNTAHTQLESFRNEKGILLQGIQKITANRDDLKTKLVCKNEISREQRAQVEKLERRLRITQSIRTKELQLLQLYRQLSLHTGYFKWGKQIRVLEAALAAALEEDDPDRL
jgi:chromosome segregation ATPase